MLAACDIWLLPHPELGQNITNLGAQTLRMIPPEASNNSLSKYTRTSSTPPIRYTFITTKLNGSSPCNHNERTQKSDGKSRSQHEKRISKQKLRKSSCTRGFSTVSVLRREISDNDLSSTPASTRTIDPPVYDHYNITPLVARHVPTLEPNRQGIQDRIGTERTECLLLISFGAR